MHSQRQPIRRFHVGWCDCVQLQVNCQGCPMSLFPSKAGGRTTRTMSLPGKSPTRHCGMEIHHSTLMWFAPSWPPLANSCMRLMTGSHACDFVCPWSSGNLFLSISLLQCKGKDPSVALPILWCRLTSQSKIKTTSQSPTLHLSLFRLLGGS